MRYKRLINLVVLEFYHLKRLGAAYFVPHIVLFILLPLFSAGNIGYHGQNAHAFLLIFNDFQRYIPFLGCWWIILGLSDCVEGPVASIFKLHRKSLLGDFILLFSWHIFHVAVLFSGYAFFLESYWAEFPVILIQSFFFASFGFFLLIASKNTMLPFVLLLGYEMISMLSNAGASLYISVFFTGRVTGAGQLLPYVPSIFMDITLLVISNSFLFKKKKPAI